MELPDSNKLLLEKNLEKLVAEICRACRLGIADWDFNESLRSAIQNSKQTKQLKELQKEFNSTFELATKSKIQLSSKFSVFYNPTK